MKLNLTLLVAGFAILGIIGEAEAGCPDGWTAWYSFKYPFYIYKCYRHFNLKKNWNDAQNYCNDQDSSQFTSGHLVMIDSLRENDLVVKLASEAGVDKVWIGLNDIDSENQFRWTSTGRLDYTKWGRGQPDNWYNGAVDEDCTMVYTSDGYWNDLSCRSYMTFVCTIGATRFRVPRYK